MYYFERNVSTFFFFKDTFMTSTLMKLNRNFFLKACFLHSTRFGDSQPPLTVTESLHLSNIHGTLPCLPHPEYYMLLQFSKSSRALRHISSPDLILIILSSSTKQNSYKIYMYCITHCAFLASVALKIQTPFIFYFLLHPKNIS